jgi:hypothetical protein
VSVLSRFAKQFGQTRKRSVHSRSLRKADALHAEALEPRRMLAVDMNADGQNDLLWIHDSGVVVGWQMKSAFELMQSRSLGGSGDWSLEAALDVDGNRVADLLWRHLPTGSTILWVMRSDGGIASSKAIGGDRDWFIEATGDYDGDGREDIIWRHAPSGINVMWLMNGPNVKAAASIGGGADWRLAGGGSEWELPTASFRFDSDGDGKTDLIWRHSSGASVLWRMNGLSVRSTRAIGGDLGWTLVGTGDFDGDGRGDLLWRHSWSGVVVSWLMNDGTVKASRAVGGSVDWSVVHTADHNRDGRSDIFWRHWSGLTVVSLMNGLDASAVQGVGGDATWRLFSGPPRRNAIPTPPPPTLPSPPAILNATAGNGQVVLQWSSSPGTVVEYEIQWSTNSSFNWPSNVAFTSGTTFTVTNLVNGAPYYFRVAATNSAGTGSYSGMVVATPSAPVASGRPGAPGAPGVARQQTMANVSWDAPVNGGSPIQGYVVQWSTDASFSSRSEQITSSLSATVNQLAAGVLYYFRVAAFNANGQGAFSAATPSAAVQAFWWEATWQFSFNRVSDGLTTDSGSASLTLFKLSDDGFTTRIRVSLMASRDSSPYKTDPFTGRGVLPYSIEGVGVWEITASSDFLKNDPNAFVGDYLSGNFIENGNYQGDPLRSRDQVFFIIYRNGERGRFAGYQPIRGVPWTAASPEVVQREPFP